jgi:medium-chain acyl-[acyl-carrier-protein] hydrolase
MQTIGAVRSLFDVAVPVFELLTKTFGGFADAVVAKTQAGPKLAHNEWVSVVDDSMQYGKLASLSAPTFVFFPQAGSSPKQYAPLFTELKKRCEHGLYLFIQPPGRDARADEPNETSCARYISQSVSALKPYLIGSDSKDGPTIFIGDSWGAIAAFATAHELYACCGWSPSHMFVSGNASPAVTTTHMGLGAYSSTPMRDLTDKDLVAFLKKSGVEEEDDSRLDALLPPFLADCQLYEDYARPSELPMLPSRLCVLRGKGDAVVTMSEISGWADEFDCDEPKILRVPDATHHVHEEQPAVVAEHVISFLGLSARTSLGLDSTPEKVPYRRSKTNSPRSGTLAPPCPFVRGIDPAALQSFREGNLLYRMGSAHGSKGELMNLANAS